MDKYKKEIPSFLQCSFCGTSAGEARKLIAGPSVYICNECVVSCTEIIGRTEGEKALANLSTCAIETNCSFCGLSQEGETSLITGMVICNECLQLCDEILSEEERTEGVQIASRDSKPPPLRCSFCWKTKTTVEQLVAGKNGEICNTCVKRCEEILAKNEGRKILMSLTTLLVGVPIIQCSFCGKGRREVDAMVTGAAICRSCIETADKSMRNGEG